MTKYRDFAPGQPLPADFPDALCEFLGAAALSFQLIIKPGAPTTLQVPAGAGNAQASIAINGCWRYNSANVERASPGGSAQTFDVYVTGSANVFVISGDHEVDNTDYAFGLAIMASGHAPTGVDLSRKVGTAVWDGSEFTSVTQTAPPLQSFTPADIGAATAVALTAEVARAEAAEAAIVTEAVLFAGRFQSFRHTFAVASDILPAGVAAMTIPLPVAFADTDFTVSLAAEFSFETVTIELRSVAAGSVNAVLTNTGNATIGDGTVIVIHVIAVHD